MPDSVVYVVKLYTHQVDHRVPNKNEVEVSRPQAFQIHEGTKTPIASTKEAADSLPRKHSNDNRHRQKVYTRLIYIFCLPVTARHPAGTGTNSRPAPPGNVHRPPSADPRPASGRHPAGILSATNAKHLPCAFSSGCRQGAMQTAMQGTKIRHASRATSGTYHKGAA